MVALRVRLGGAEERCIVTLVEARPATRMQAGYGVLNRRNMAVPSLVVSERHSRAGPTVSSDSQSGRSGGIKGFLNAERRLNGGGKCASVGLPRRSSTANSKNRAEVRSARQSHSIRDPPTKGACRSDDGNPRGRGLIAPPPKRYRECGWANLETRGQDNGGSRRWRGVGEATGRPTRENSTRKSMQMIVPVSGSPRVGDGVVESAGTPQGPVGERGL